MGLLDTAVTMLAHVKNKGGTRKPEQIKYLVYHYTGNDGDHAASKTVVRRHDGVGKKRRLDGRHKAAGLRYTG